MLSLYQRHALKGFWASVGDEEGHKADCILALRAGQALKFHSLLTPENLLPIPLPGINLIEYIKWYNFKWQIILWILFGMQIILK